MLIIFMMVVFYFMASEGLQSLRRWFTLALTRPNDHHDVVAMLTHETVPLFERERGLLTRADGRMSGSELTEALPVGDIVG